MDISFQLTEFIGLLLIATVVGVAVKYIKLPYTIALVVVGLFAGLLRVFPEVKLTQDLIFFLVLPPLLFEGALNMNLDDLKTNFRSISILATAGVVLSVIVTGYLIHYFLQIPLMLALLFGAMITPTDPVSVLATFKELGAPRKLATIMEGESILNDGTGIVIFSILLEMIRGSFDPLNGLLTFFFVVIGGAAVGLAIGYISYKILGFIDDHQIEVAITLIVAFSTFIIAEYLHVSGVIAVVAAGLIIGNYGTYFSMSPTTRVALVTFWGFFVFVINSIIFLLIGIDIHFDKILAFGSSILLAIPAVLIGRAVATYFLLLPPISGERFSIFWKNIIFWGGLHGTIPVALALSLADIPFRDQLASMTFGVVLFSLVFQGLSLEFIARRYFGRKDEKRMKYESLMGRRIALKASLEEIERMRRDGEIPAKIADRLSQDIMALLENISEELSSMLTEDIEKDVWLSAWRKVLLAQKSALRDAARKGYISDEVASNLMQEVDSELEKERETR
ncbi:MAG: Na+/H+ antiporter [Archaeoglobus sp.]|nr:Na+/H+ antiporter [Archaeoglobus sp.]